MSDWWASDITPKIQAEQNERVHLLTFVMQLAGVTQNSTLQHKKTKNEMKRVEKTRFWNVILV